MGVGCQAWDSALDLTICTQGIDPPNHTTPLRAVQEGWNASFMMQGFIPRPLEGLTVV